MAIIAPSSRVSHISQTALGSRLRYSAAITENPAIYKCFATHGARRRDSGSICLGAMPAVKRAGGSRPPGAMAKAPARQRPISPGQAPAEMDASGVAIDACRSEIGIHQIGILHTPPSLRRAELSLHPRAK